MALESIPDLSAVGPDDYVTLTGGAAPVSPRRRSPRASPPAHRAGQAARPSRPPPRSGPRLNAETNPLARASLVLSVVWLFGLGSLAAILLGGVAQRQIDFSEGRETGRHLATAGIAIGAIGAVIAIALAIALAGP